MPWSQLRVLLDEQLPRVIAAELPGHDVRTVESQGWRGIKNGTLLRLAVAAGFQAFVTADRGLEFEQNIARLELGVVMLVARSNRLEHLLPSLLGVLQALEHVGPGQLVKVTA